MSYIPKLTENTALGFVADKILKCNYKLYYKLSDQISLENLIKYSETQVGVRLANYSRMSAKYREC